MEAEREERDGEGGEIKRERERGLKRERGGRESMREG